MSCSGGCALNPKPKVKHRFHKTEKKEIDTRTINEIYDDINNIELENTSSGLYIFNIVTSSLSIFIYMALISIIAVNMFKV